MNRGRRAMFSSDVIGATSGTADGARWPGMLGMGAGSVRP